MGWWENNELNVTLGDEVLDLSGDFLNKFSSIYLENLERLPTTQELEYVLNLAFGTKADHHLLEDLSEKEISAVTLKTKKIKKRETPKSGDIFSFKIEENLYGFGLIVSEVIIGHVALIFKVKSKWPTISLISSNTPSFEPIIIDSYSLFNQHLEGEWKIIQRNKNYQPDPSLEKTLFVFGDTPDNLKAKNIYNQTQKISLEDSKNKPKLIALGNQSIINMVT